MTDLIILATLIPGPKHGYQIKHEAGVILGQEAIHNNLVYPLLRRFVSKKWVSRKSVPGERGQTRQQYALTPLGRKDLISRLSSFTENDARGSAPFRLRVAMFSLLGPQTRHQILDTRERVLKAHTQKLHAIQQNFELGPYAGEVVSHFRAESSAELEWIARLRRREKQNASKE
jgi:DNA-binding PadR family transcriptional regulator